MWQSAQRTTSQAWASVWNRRGEPEDLESDPHLVARSHLADAPKVAYRLVDGAVVLVGPNGCDGVAAQGSGPAEQAIRPRQQLVVRDALGPLEGVEERHAPGELPLHQGAGLRDGEPVSLVEPPDVGDGPATRHVLLDLDSPQCPCAEASACRQLGLLLEAPDRPERPRVKTEALRVNVPHGLVVIRSRSPAVTSRDLELLLIRCGTSAVAI